MNIVIITSEPLNPNNTLGSTFELTQAKILSRSYSVAILSVRTGESMGAKVKALVKSLIKRETTASRRNVSDLKKSIAFLLLKKPVVQNYIIEGIRVYEGRGFFYKGNSRFNLNLRTWVKAGHNAFLAIRKAIGTPDIIHAHGRFLNAGVLALELNKTFNIPYIYTEHSSHFANGTVPPPAIPILNNIIDHAARYTAVSADLLTKVENVLQRQINATIVANVIDPLFEAPITRANGLEQKFRFVNIASLDANKNHALLLRAFKKAFSGDLKYELNICGEGELFNYLITLTAELGLSDCVNFVGRKSKYEVLQLLDRSDAFVLSSKTETFGVALMEAIARGLPVISTRSGGPESIVNETCGLLVDSDNEDQLAFQMRQVSSTIKYNRDDIRKYALEKYGAASFMKAMENIYKLPG